MESSAAPIGGGVPVPGRGRARRRAAGAGGVGPLGLGVTMIWLSLIVLLPLAALTVKALDGGLGGIWDAITAPSAKAALILTIVISLIVAAINVVVGTLIAWVLVRDEFGARPWSTP